MKEQELLDDGFNDENANLLEAVEWWEKKRLLYNILLFGAELLIMIRYWNGTMNYGLVEAAIGTISNNIVANMFYTIGWGLEILFLYYSSKEPFTNGLRLVWYLIGLIISFSWVWIAYSEQLS